MNTAAIIVALYFAGIIVFTYLGVRKQNRALASGGDYENEQFTGGGRIGGIALAILVAAGSCSTGTFVGLPGTSAINGVGYCVAFLGHICMVLCTLGIFGKKMNIIGRRTHSNSYLDLIRHRYESYKPLVLFLAFAIVVFSTASAAAEFVGGTRVIETCTGIPYRFSLIVFALIITLYTALGGMTGVSSVGILQGFVMTIGSVILLVGYLVNIGGFGTIMTKMGEIDPALLTPNIGGSVPLIGIFEFWCMYGLCTASTPWVAQSTLTYNNTKAMRRAIIVGSFMCAMWTIFIAQFGGGAARIFDPTLTAATGDYASSRLAFGILPAGFGGIVLAAIAGAGQSTIAALFIVIAGTVVTSIYKLYINKDATSKQSRKVSLGITVAVGVITCVIALAEPKALMTLISFAQGGCASSMYPVMILGLFWPRANKKGALCGLIFGMFFYILNYVADIGVPFLHTNPMLCTIPLTFIIIVVVSLATEKPDKKTLESYFGEIA